MSPRLQRALSFTLGVLIALSAAVTVLAALLEGSGTSSALMTWRFQQDAPPEDTGLDASEYSGVADMITGYLAGTVDTFQYTVTSEDGTETALFHENEQLHMADCLQLFRLCRRVLLMSGICLMLFALAAAWRHDARRVALGCFSGSCAALLAVAALGIWALVDFNGLFILFHRLSFTNELWYMDPATDLIIRLMPLKFFIHYVTLIAVTWLIAILLLGGGSLMVAVRLKRRKRP